jgi:filamentous hemagglutinin family protein
VNKALSPLFHLSLCTLGCLYASSTQAQVTSDDTVNTQVNQNGNVAEITGGQTRGSNLFHSFQEFSVGTNNEAFFNNAIDISNIFSRVTGGKISNIDGLIRANGSANLFLINPAGIIFGENARLDVGGSFYGSTADSVLFEDGEFSATDLNNPPVLTINVPIGLGFRDNPAEIQDRNIQTTDKSESLTGSVGKNLALIGGDIDLQGTILNLAGGQFTIGELGSAGTIQINKNGSLSFPNDAPLASVLLENSQLSVETSENSFIFADAISLDRSQVVSGFGLGGIGDSGDITINTGSLVLINGSRIETLGFGEGNTGDIKINATKDVFLEGINSEGFSSSIVTSLEIEDTLSILNNSSISTSAFDNANAGNINIDSTFIIGSRSEVNELSSAAEQGQAGNIKITAEFLLGVDIKTSGVEYSSGNTSIFVDQINQVKDSVELEPMVDQTCQSDLVGEKPSGLSIEGKGGVTPAPDLPLNSQNIIDGETNSAYNIPEPIETSEGKIQPARGIKFTKDGRIILTAYRTNNAGERIPEIKPNCGNTLTTLD